MSHRRLPFSSTLYIAGKMRGIELYNFKRFFYWQVLLEEAGYNVINPAAMDVERMLEGWVFDESKYEEVLAIDLAVIKEKADGIFALDGWEDSEGARREIALAESLGLPVIKEGNRL